MKYFNSIILTGIMIHFLPLSAEFAEAEEALTSEWVAETEEATLTSLDEELSLLDEEFEEFKEELSAMEEAIHQNEQELPSIAERFFPAAITQEEPVALSEQSEAEEENAIALESLIERIQSAEESLNVELNAVAVDLPVVDNAFVEEEIPVENVQMALSQEGISAEIVQTALTDSEVPMEHVQMTLAEKDLEQDVPAILNIQGTSMIGEPAPLNSDAIVVDLEQAFSASPIIYSLLLAMSVFSVCIWLYSLLSMRSSARVSPTFLKNVQNRLNSNNFEDALLLCNENSGFFCKMVSSGIHSRRHGLPVMIEAMKAEGKRSTVSFWQKIGLLNDIAIIAPMLGLLGTVLGMFYAFYDVNRSIESVSSLFDGLGVSVGTTVAGLIVAILAMILHSTAKYRLVRALAQVENEAQSVAVLIDDRTSIHKG